MTTLDDAKIAAIRAGLLGWFAANRRDLPWRRTRDPYAILVSEVMLQQTQVDRVIPYYHAWLDRFPDAAALASAPTADVITAWAGLGYNRRAVNLQRTARYVTDELGGVFPDDAPALLALPGVGPYTAGAIACFAFERDVAFLDTNMRRVLHRLAFGPDLVAGESRPRADREVLEVAAQLVPPGEGWTWNQALIEFGALHCTARKPACVVCPLQASCRAFPEILMVIATRPKGRAAKPEVPFIESNRYFRGRIVDALRAAPGDGLSLAALGPLVRPGFTDDDLPWLEGVVAGLARDGLAQVDAAPAVPSGETARAIAEAPASYDATATAAVAPVQKAGIMVRLPS